MITVMIILSSYIHRCRVFHSCRMVFLHHAAENFGPKTTMTSKSHTQRCRWAGSTHWLSWVGSAHKRRTDGQTTCLCTLFQNTCAFSFTVSLLLDINDCSGTSSYLGRCYTAIIVLTFRNWRKQQLKSHLAASCTDGSCSMLLVG